MAVVVFAMLCLLIILGRYFARHKGEQTRPGRAWLKWCLPELGGWGVSIRLPCPAVQVFTAALQVWCGDCGGGGVSRATVQPRLLPTLSSSQLGVRT